MTPPISVFDWQPILRLIACRVRIVTATRLSRRLRRSKSTEVVLIDHNRAPAWKPICLVPEDEAVVEPAG